MTDKEAVRTLESHAMIERIDEGYLIRKHPEGRILGPAASLLRELGETPE